MSAPARGEVWLADLNPTRGHEQAGRRPVVVVSHDAFNRGAADLVIVLPVTSRARAVLTHVKVSPKQGCLPMPSAVMCENIRSISKDRLLRRFGMLEASGIRRVDDVLRSLLRL